MKKVINTEDSDGIPFKITIETTRNYFSITADGYRRCGCLHDEILELRPDLKCFVDLHLSDLDGVPMHAEANGWYWLAKAAGIPQRWEPNQDSETCLEYFRDHVRLPSCISIIEAIQKAYQDGRLLVATSDVVTIRCQEEMHKVGVEQARKFWQSLMGVMIPRWKAEADIATKMLSDMIKDGES